jgi:ADP-ribose pyrophosphatase YjhB (NUDIX family)
VGAVFDQAGRVLIVEHAFRTDFPWGLPGGWVEPGEQPRDAVARELREELRLNVEVRDLVLCDTIGRVRTSTHPVHLGLAYYCRLLSPPAPEALSMEVLAFEWIEPAKPTHVLAPFQNAAIEIASRLHQTA